MQMQVWWPAAKAQSAYDGLQPLPVEARSLAEVLAEEPVKVARILKAAAHADFDDFLITHPQLCGGVVKPRLVDDVSGGQSACRFQDRIDMLGSLRDSAKVSVGQCFIH
jgi:hypothetical protein